MSTLANIDVERVILGSCLLEEQGLYEVVSLIKPDDFSLESNRRIFSAMVDVSTAGKPLDIISLTESLRDKKWLEAVGGVAYIHLLTEGMPRRENLKHHAAILLDSSKRRKARTAGERLMNMTDDPTVETQDCLRGIQEALLSIETDSAKTPAKHIKSIMPDVLHELELQASQEGLAGLPTGINGLDVATGGLRLGELCVVGALSGRGKTALATQMMLASGLAGNASAIFSLEMSQIELGKRFLAAKSNFSASKIRNPKYIGNDWVPLYTTAGEISECPLYVDDSGSLRIEELMARARLYIRRYGVKLILVDHLRLVDAPGRELRERVAYVPNSLRQLAKSERIAVVLLSQLRRPPCLNDRPTMLELKESGDIEAHAHVVLLIYMPMAQDGNPTGEEELIVGKNRNGSLGSLPVTFSHKKLQFFDRDTGRKASDILPEEYAEATK